MQASRKMSSRGHHPESAAEMAGGATMTLTKSVTLDKATMPAVAATDRPLSRW
jgi:hypothetical protein